MSDAARAEDVEVEDDENDIIIEEVDDTPEEDRGRPVGTQADEDDDDGEIPEDEIREYSGRVQGRIKKLTQRYHNARRGEEAAAREASQAAEYAARLRQENEQLRKALKSGETVLVDSGKAGAEAKLEAARKGYRDALEEGDPDKIVQAQEALDNALDEKRRWEGYKPRYQQERPANQQGAQPQPQRRQPPKPDHRAQQWAEQNPWFGQDRGKTGFALGVHEELIGKGIRPDTDPDTYYDTLNKRIAQAFPSEGRGQPEQDAPLRRPSNPTAPVSRSARTGKRTVTLTNSEIAIAKRMGISKEQYAKEKLRLQQEG